MSSGGSVFVDSSAHGALLNARDGAHDLARRVARRIAGERRRTLTTNFVVAETHALLVARAGRRLALAFLERTLEGPTDVVRVEAADEERALEIIRRHEDKDFSVTDATSFAVMSRLGIRVAFAFDRHFAQYGFVLLEP